MSDLGIKIANTVAHLPKAMVTSKAYQKLIKSKIKRSTFANATAAAMLSSIVLKDGIGCVMYVEQSKHNKKIPEERRDFVWKLDAVNGGLMIAFQILFFLGMRKFNNKLFDKWFPALRKKNLNGIGEISRAEAKKAGKEVKPKSEQRQEYINIKTGLLETFRTITELVASTIIAKRIVVPLIATDITNRLESHHGKKIDNKKQNNQPNTNVASQNPSQTGSNLNVVSADNGETNLIERYKHNNIK